MTRLAALLCLSLALLATPARALSIYAHTQSELTVETVYPVAGNEWQYYPVISGLRSHAAERAVNRRIRALYKELRDAKPPAYRGIRLLKRAEDGEGDPVYVNALARTDNLLCVQAVRDQRYIDPRTGDTISVSDTRSACFDLRTGRKLRLGDLFRAGADWKGYVDGAVSACIMRRGAADEYDAATVLPEDYWEKPQVYAPPFTLTAPFAGVGEDPAFLLQGFGPYLWLSLIIDERTPAFQTNYSWSLIEIPLCELMDFNVKFQPEIPAGALDERRWFLQEVDVGGQPAEPLLKISRPLGDECAVFCRTEGTLGADWPEALRDAALRFAREHGLADEAVSQYQRNRDAGGDLSFYADTYLSSYRAGDYLNLWCRCSVSSRAADGAENEILWEGHRAAFRIDTGKAMDAQAIFSESDWRDALADGMLKAMARWPDELRKEIAPELGSVRKDTRWADAADALANGVAEFGIGSESLMFGYDPDAPLPSFVNGEALRDQLDAVDYADIGYGRLRLFQ